MNGKIMDGIVSVEDMDEEEFADFLVETLCQAQECLTMQFEGGKMGAAHAATMWPSLKESLAECIEQFGMSQGDE